MLFFKIRHSIEYRIVQYVTWYLWQNLAPSGDRRCCCQNMKEHNSTSLTVGSDHTSLSLRSTGTKMTSERIQYDLNNRIASDCCMITVSITYLAHGIGIPPDIECSLTSIYFVSCISIEPVVQCDSSQIKHIKKYSSLSSERRKEGRKIVSHLLESSRKHHVERGFVQGI